MRPKLPPGYLREAGAVTMEISIGSAEGVQCSLIVSVISYELPSASSTLITSLRGAEPEHSTGRAQNTKRSACRSIAIRPTWFFRGELHILAGILTIAGG